jgi:spore coat protein JB
MNYDFYDDMNVINGYMPYMNNQNNLDLYSPYEGFLRGNAFRDQYIPYKNYRVAKINFNSEQEEMLFNISEYHFMMHEMNLYLDIYPEDKEARDKFNEYRNKVNELITKYERKYGPLCVTSSDDTKSFDWVKNWPWVN